MYVICLHLNSRVNVCVCVVMEVCWCWSLHLMSRGLKRLCCATALFIHPFSLSLFLFSPFTALVELTKRIRQKDSPSIDRTSLHISHQKRVWICVWRLKFKYMPQIRLAVTHRGCQISLNDKFSISVSFSHNVIFLSCTPMVIKQQHSEKLENVPSLHTDVGGLLQKQKRLL